MTVSLQELFYDDRVSVYPNPSQGTFNISAAYFEHVQICDAVGKELTLPVTKSGHLLSYTINRPGVYFIRVTSKGIFHTRRLVIIN